MNKMLPATLLVSIPALFALTPLARADTQYELRVDGLACPYCAYGIEKKIKALDGVIDGSLQVKLNEGIVTFKATNETSFKQPALQQLVDDSGFTLRTMKIYNHNPEEQTGGH